MLEISLFAFAALLSGSSLAFFYTSLPHRAWFFWLAAILLSLWNFGIFFAALALLHVTLLVTAWLPAVSLILTASLGYLWIYQSSMKRFPLLASLVLSAVFCLLFYWWIGPELVPWLAIPNLVPSFITSMVLALL